MTSPYSSNGTNRQEDVCARNIARQAISEAISQEAKQTAILVSIIVGRVMMNKLSPKSIDAFWTDIQMDAQLKAARIKADANVADYPGFSGWLNGERINLEFAQKKRMKDAIGARIHQARFANTKGFVPAYV